MMSGQSVSEKYLALAKECERWARDCERRMIGPELSDLERFEQSELAKSYWQMARDHTEAGMRLDAERGKKVAEGQRTAADQTNALYKPMRETRFARLSELTKKMSLESAAALCEREGLGKAGAIVRQWNRWKK